MTTYLKNTERGGRSARAERISHHVKFARACEYMTADGRGVRADVEVDQQNRLVHTKKLFGAMTALAGADGGQGRHLRPQGEVPTRRHPQRGGGASGLSEALSSRALKQLSAGDEHVLSTRSSSASSRGGAFRSTWAWSYSTWRRSTTSLRRWRTVP
jgi:hypothetical protein